MKGRVGTCCFVLGAWAGLVPDVSLCLVPGVGAQAVTPAPAPSTARQLVVPFENATGEPRVYWLSEGSAVLVTDDLIALGVPAMRREDRVRAFERLRVPAVATLSHATVIRLGQVVGASQVVVGAFDLQGGDLVVRARTIRLDTGRISPELVERGPLDDLLSIYGRIARRIAASDPIVPAEQLTRGYPPLPAFEQYIKGLLAEAPTAQITFLTQALRVYPAFQRARVALWDVHTAQGDHQQALDAVREVPADHQLARRARFFAAVSMLHLGRYQEAFDAFIELHRAKADPALVNNLGVVQLRRPAGAAGASTGRGAAASPPAAGGRAVSRFGEAIALDGSDADLFFNLGYAFWLDRDTQGAIHWLREAVRRNPADDEAHYVLGVALQATGSTAEAAREKDLARRLSSTYAEWEAKQPGANAAPRGLERLRLEIDVPESLRVDAAVVAAEQRDQREIAAFHLDRGRRLFEAERDADAIADLRRTIFLAPYESQAHLLLGRIYLRTGRPEDAIDALTIAVWSDPANAEAQALLDSLH
ncbi:MAG: tetratricopeptide repeat protein [Acidobacteria bacterium]|nr:tetratricopeptide repeat protein [Acidobacteriota bacterium]